MQSGYALKTYRITCHLCGSFQTIRDYQNTTWIYTDNANVFPQLSHLCFVFSCM